MTDKMKKLLAELRSGDDSVKCEALLEAEEILRKARPFHRPLPIAETPPLELLPMFLLVASMPADESLALEPRRTAVWVLGEWPSLLCGKAVFAALKTEAANHDDFAYQAAHALQNVAWERIKGEADGDGPVTYYLDDEFCTELEEALDTLDGIQSPDIYEDFTQDMRDILRQRSSRPG